MQLDFSLTLPEALYQELIADCRACEVSPKQYAAEALESVIASRRLPKVEIGTHGAFTSGMCGAARLADEDKEMVLTERRILL